MEISSDLKFHKDRLAENIAYLDDFFKKREMNWTLVIKLFNSFKTDIIDYIQDMEIKSVASDNLNHLHFLKKQSNDIETWFLNYDGVEIQDDLIDVDLTHKPNSIPEKKCFMLEIDTERFGIKVDNIQAKEFYYKVKRVGAYLDCEKLPKKCLINKWRSFSFSSDILQSLGTSVSISEIDSYRRAGINHFRIGELAFFGKDILKKQKFEGLRNDIFEPTTNNKYYFVSNIKNKFKENIK